MSNSAVRQLWLRSELDSTFIPCRMVRWGQKRRRSASRKFVVQPSERPDFVVTIREPSFGSEIEQRTRYDSLLSELCGEIARTIPSVKIPIAWQDLPVAEDLHFGFVCSATGFEIVLGAVGQEACAIKQAPMSPSRCGEEVEIRTARVARDR